jgi:hypothetical protein
MRDAASVTIVSALAGAARRGDGDHPNNVERFAGVNSSSGREGGVL